MSQRCMQQCSHIVSVCYASVVRGCVPLRTSSSLIYHFWFLKHHHSAAMPHHHRRCWRSCRTHENCMQAEQIIIIFYIFIFIFCTMYLVLLSIVLYGTIVTVYTDNVFLYNYLRQMHDIIHLSPAGCFTPARGKTVQKYREVSGVKEEKSLGNLLSLEQLKDRLLCWPVASIRTACVYRESVCRNWIAVYVRYSHAKLFALSQWDLKK